MTQHNEVAMDWNKVERAKKEILQRWYSSSPGGFGYEVTHWSDDEINAIEQWFPSIRGFSEAALNRTEDVGRKYLAIILPFQSVDPEDNRVRAAISELTRTKKHSATGMSDNAIGIVERYWEQNGAGILSVERTNDQVILTVCSASKVAGG